MTTTDSRDLPLWLCLHLCKVYYRGFCFWFWFQAASCATSTPPPLCIGHSRSKPLLHVYSVESGQAIQIHCDGTASICSVRLAYHNAVMVGFFIFYFWFNKLVSFFPFPLLDPLMVSCCAKPHCMKPTLHGAGMRPPWLALTTQFFLVLHDPLISFSLVFTSIYTRKNMAHLSNCTDGVRSLQGVVQTHSAA